MATTELDQFLEEAKKLADTLNEFRPPSTGVDTIDDALDGLSIVTFQDATHVVGVSWDLHEDPQDTPEPVAHTYTHKWAYYVRIR